MGKAQIKLYLQSVNERIKTLLREKGVSVAQLRMVQSFVRHLNSY